MTENKDLLDIPQKKQSRQKVIEKNSLKIVIKMVQCSSSQLLASVGGWGLEKKDSGFLGFFFFETDHRDFDHAPIGIWTTWIRCGDFVCVCGGVSKGGKVIPGRNELWNN